MTSDVSGYRPTPGRDAMTRDGRHRASGLTRNEVGGFDGHLQDLAGVYVAHPTWDESGRVLVLNVEYPEGWSLVRDADPLPDADVWVPKVGDRVKLVKDGLSTTGAVGMEGVIKKIEDRTYPYLIELDKGLVYKSHAVSHQYRLTRADRGCFVSAVRPAPSGPVVEETVKRIVPGRYGVVEVALVAEARDGIPREEDAAYIAAANPAAILSLIEENKRMREALTPSAETKAAYIGEFRFSVLEYVDDDGTEYESEFTVPWTTIKEIMAAIRARAALTPATGA